MSKPRSVIGDFAVYLVVRLFVCLVQALPFTVACHLALAMAWLAYRIDRRHREVAGENLRRSFPGRFRDDEVDQLVRRVYRHFCTMLIEIIHLPRRLHPNNWRTYLDLSTSRQLVPSLLSGRPLLIVTGHYGNWEMAGYAMALLGFATHAIARPLDNRFVDDFLRRFREATGQRLLAKKGDFDRMQSILDSGGVLATLADQDAGQRGLFVNFFGRPASTHKAVALLALEHRVPLVVIAVIRDGAPLHYRAVIEDLILPEEYDGRADAVRAMTQRYTTALERLIALAPEQYFWLHRRWKHQPQVRKGKMVA